MKVYCVDCAWKRKIPNPALVSMLPRECPYCGGEIEIKEG